MEIRLYSVSVLSLILLFFSYTAWTETQASVAPQAESDTAPVVYARGTVNGSEAFATDSATASGVLPFSLPRARLLGAAPAGLASTTLDSSRTPSAVATLLPFISTAEASVVRPDFSTARPVVEQNAASSMVSVAGKKPQSSSSKGVVFTVGKESMTLFSGANFYEDGCAFSVHRLGKLGGRTVLVVGGIQGDEPGGFSAASLLTTHYEFTQGAVWVVPNLNFHSIVQRSRGLYGDMNRKFSVLAKADPESAAVRHVQELILDPAVDIVLNLHDGSGYYRPSWEDSLRNPNRWGQSIIIDQGWVNTTKYADLTTIATNVVASVNGNLLSQGHRFHLHNTQTALGNQEMEKTLSYFAVRNNKAAFGLEASKEFTTQYRTYYHLLSIESFFRQAGIEFTRKFPLTPEGVLFALNSNIDLALYGDRIVLPLDDVRASLGVVPLQKGAENLGLRPSKPLLAVVKDNGGWRIMYGNRVLTRMTPEFVDYDYSLSSVTIEIDGKPRTVQIGEKITVTKNFTVQPQDGYRVNAIGAMAEVNGSECNVLLQKKDFIPRFSLDTGATMYRVEFYKGKAFAGMVLVEFGAAQNVHLTQQGEALSEPRGVASAMGK